MAKKSNFVTPRQPNARRKPTESAPVEIQVESTVEVVDEVVSVDTPTEIEGQDDVQESQTTKPGKTDKSWSFKK